MSDLAIMVVKTRVRMNDLAAEAGVALRQEAGEFKGLCPFHADTDPSFTVYQADDGVQRFRCFGCGAAGDIFDFYIRWRNVTMAVALQELAARVGVDLRDRPGQATRKMRTTRRRSAATAEGFPALAPAELLGVDDASEQELVLDRLPSAPVDADAVFPEHWLVNEKGVYEATSRDGEMKFKSIVATAVVITGRARNLDTELETVTVAFMRDGRWRSLTVERDTLADKGRIVRLSARGLLVTSNTAGRLVQYLADYETANLDAIPEKMVVSVSGWRTDPEGNGALFVAGGKLLGLDPTAHETPMWKMGAVLGE